MTALLARLSAWHSRALILLVCGSLTACGFQPADQAAPFAKTQSSQTFVLGLEDREGQLLRNAMVQRLSPKGEPTDPKYLLEMKLSTSKTGVGSTRRTMVFTTTYKLLRPDTRAQLFAGQVSDEIAFNEQSAAALNVYPQDAAMKRGVERTADRVEQALMVFFATQNRGREILDEML